MSINKAASFFGIIALALITGFFMTACEQPDGNSTVHVISITLSETSLTMTVGEEKVLAATITPNNATNQYFEWSSSDSTIVSVAGGRVTAKAAGSAIITVKTKDGGITAECTVTVTSGGGSGIPNLSGNITINPLTATVGAVLTAVYSGTETVSYQWNKDGTALNGKTATTLTADTAGSYTVTVNAEGYKSKTSAAVDVNDPSLATLSGNITISPTSAVVNTELTATYSGSETVSYHWEKDGNSVGTNSNKFTPTTAGSYTVTVRASGYNPKTSAPVSVTSGDGGTGGTGDGGGDETNTNPKSIKITGIISPANTKGNVEISIFSGNFDLPGGGMVALGTSDIVNKTVSVDLYNWTSVGGTSANRWTGNGEWCIRLKFRDSTDNHGIDYVWKNHQKYNIRNTVTELNFTDFVYVWEENPLNGWYGWVAPDSTATLNYSVAADGVCTITVGGTPEPQNETDGWNIWKVSAQLEYTAKANTRYTYTFEAWTASGARDLYVQYYYDNVEDSNLGKNINITGTKKTYTINGEKIPKGGIRNIEFQCADQTGTFYVKMLEIKEYNGGGTDTDLNNWQKWETPGSTATLNYSVAADGVCTITVGGTPVPDHAWWEVNAQLKYTAKANTRYAYTFEAWTQSGARTFRFQYYNDNDENVSLNTEVNITGTRTTYTIYGEEIPKNGTREIEFQCANQTGTFYVKMLEIKETNWRKWEAPGTTATLNYSVANDGVCTITVGGATGSDIGNVCAQLEYTAKANTRYAYTFEAWTPSGARTFRFQYYSDNDVSLASDNVNITGTRTTYTIYGGELPKDGIRTVDFQCANQTGTFYVKMLEIKEY